MSNSVLVTRTLGEDSVKKTLAHYGVPGMRWGVRKRSSTSSSASSEPVSEDHMQAVLARSKPAATLTNAEMRSLIERAELEKRYRQVLSTPKPVTRGDKAKAFVHDLLVEVGTSELRRVTKSAAAIQVENALTGTKQSGKEFSKVLGERIKPKKK